MAMGSSPFVVEVWAANGDRYGLLYTRPNPMSKLLDGLTLSSIVKCPNGSDTWDEVATNAPGIVVPSTLNMRDHIANENVKNFFEWGLGSTSAPANVFSSPPIYYSAPTTPAGASGGAFVEQAKDLNIGLTFTNGQWNPAQ
jgi:hypothetical protein